MGDEHAKKPRALALAAGLKRYFNGKPCKQGHIDERQTSNGQCITCRRQAATASGRREHFNRYRALWRKKNPERNRAIQARQFANPEVRLAHNMRTRVRRMIQRAGLTKWRKHSTLFGASAEEVRAYLEARFKPGMSWDNWGFGPDKWHLDHIVPVASFDLAVPGELERAFHYSNLQPLWQHENLSKGSKVTEL